eukprot:460400-Hanusia_phi.AAC.1
MSCTRSVCARQRGRLTRRVAGWSDRRAWVQVRRRSAEVAGGEERGGALLLLAVAGDAWQSVSTQGRRLLEG